MTHRVQRLLLALLPCTLMITPLAHADTNSDDTLGQERNRQALERQAMMNPVAITVYKRNYLMPYTYNSRPNAKDFKEIDEAGVDRGEVKFQFSVKVGLLDNIFGDNGDLYFAYTQRSWWQAYNADASSPFRETNYEPEIFLSFDNDYDLGGWNNTANRVGLLHQSNGRSDPLSRSWNRIYVDSIWQKGKLTLSVAPFWRIPESSSNDDNPDIEDYVGYADITVGYLFDNQHEVTLLTRGNPAKGHFGNQLDYSFPLHGKIRGMVQYYEGYGESMIDYNHYNRRIGIGFSLNTSFLGIPDTL
ncbi:phospholipase A [Kushneria pakistanensis]|uniref:Phospholipase A1 n=1 Tax=Kushneria pakistanensis TaxID=1508770 RepID=A0ABQ3FN41_9GAMM|nr:phospholipase A [Kushneria pakistanensis]GHC31127.1 phospholipase A [Kushneria pakistanensis]